MKLVTLSYAPSLGGFDDRPLAEFVRDKEVLAVREQLGERTARSVAGIVGFFAEFPGARPDSCPRVLLSFC